MQGGIGGSAPPYADVAVVEYVNSDGSILVSEANVINQGSGTRSWRVLDRATVEQIVLFKERERRMRERLKQAQPLVIVLLLVLLTTLGGGYFNEKKENAQIKNQKEKEQQVLKKTLEEKNGQLNDLSRKIEQLLDEKEVSC
uniref:Orf10 protein n=1 Tax=Enterococcus faecalis TaxID=1351 RepID=Q47793_ENTFL|nr:orf10 [Enterococcus faecalis] [Enterococcus faecalis OG1X]